MEFCTMTAKEYREFINNKFPKVPKESKYHAQKTQLDGITFDSKKEANRYEELCKMEACGVIQELKRQVRFELQPAFVNNKGEKVKKIEYVADYVYFDGTDWVVEDVKSAMTKKLPVYKIKRKMFEFKYPDYKFVEFT